MMRNILVEHAADLAVRRIDSFIAGEKLSNLPPAETRSALEIQLNHSSNSVRLASLFLAFYAVTDREWDCNFIPTGIRGAYGDKRLATQLGLRNITLHNAITAFGENLGWKGNVANARLQNDSRFEVFARTLARLSGIYIDDVPRLKKGRSSRSALRGRYRYRCGLGGWCGRV
jgi:hypothetical protein